MRAATRHGASVCDGGLMIDLSPMKTTQVDPRARILRCGPGLRAGEVDAATQPFGLAAPLGCNPVVGISGLTLGGGIGWFAGKHGATCDNLTSARIVGGRPCRRQPRQNPDLFGLAGRWWTFRDCVELEYASSPSACIVTACLSLDVCTTFSASTGTAGASPDELTARSDPNSRRA